MEEYNLSIRQTYSNLSDNDLSFPSVGYKTTQSLLLSQVLKVQELKVRQAVRECDPCGVSQSFPDFIWRLVIHGGIDGYSRFPVYLNVGNYNRADTVLYAFLEAVQQFGLPRRVRSDKGGENVLVAEYMVEHQPTVYRPFIAGRSVHNQRLWREVWTGVTSLYYAIFYGLGNEGILDPTREVHIMMLHLVFVPRIQTHVNRLIQKCPTVQDKMLTDKKLMDRKAFYRGSEMTNKQFHLYYNQARVDTDVYGIDYNPETVLFHQESVEVPATMEIGDDHRQRIQDILQNDSNNLT
ncbi:hypothetical protein MAR_027587 [Mya arenaria]|uniref:Integrase core domain-containing protein n=1 Tax=Mya arenaria TaxID=6604 RepID=A0ABY7EWZ4_MYAAR|nr:hypothetical protein MAR_027587 [Mya arenaria]